MFDLQGSEVYRLGGRHQSAGAASLCGEVVDEDVRAVGALVVVQVLIVTVGDGLVVCAAGALTYRVDVDVTAGDAMTEVFHIVHSEGKDWVVANVEPCVSIPAANVGTLVGGVLLISSDGDVAIVPLVRRCCAIAALLGVVPRILVRIVICLADESGGQAQFDARLLASLGTACGDGHIAEVAALVEGNHSTLYGCYRLVAAGPLDERLGALGGYGGVGELDRLLVDGAIVIRCGILLVDGDALRLDNLQHDNLNRPQDVAAV